MKKAKSTEPSVKEISLKQDVILLKEIIEPTKAGLVIIDNREREIVPSKKGEVLSVGPKCLELSVGDKVLFEGYAGEPVNIKGENLLMMREKDVIGICA